MTANRLTLAIGHALHRAVEGALACVPRSKPDAATRRDVRIVSHRGERDNRVVFENTFAAFDSLIDAGVWGIEFDVRWTRDLEPVVIHDLDLLRVFDRPWHINTLTRTQLHEVAPEIPSLDELVTRYAGRLHYMIELKAEHFPDPRRQRSRLQQVLAELSPAQDFHLMSLNTDVFDLVRDLPANCWLPVARTNTRAMSRFALEKGCAGIAGAYPLLTRELIQQHHSAGQQVGVGFPSHRNTFRHAVQLGVDWIFTNRALHLQAMLH